ncbi:MAG: tRNA pseudouridine(55) synthase TruB [Bdellovibrionota bacterium]
MTPETQTTQSARPPKRKWREDIHGIVIVDKPADITSFAAVKAVKNIFSAAKAGHTGTLDPFATGVLPICLNRATKIAGLVSGLVKEYKTVMRLGVSSDTYDRTGKVQDHGITKFPAREEIDRAIQKYIGTISQTPPLFSAIKVEGKPLYKLARKGESYDMEKKARFITIERYEILSYEPPLLEVYIRAHKGTYVRSLAQDLGKDLGTGALLDSLVRTRVGPFSIDDAYSLDELREIVKESRESEVLRKWEEVMDAIPEFAVSRADFLELSQGKIRTADAVEKAAPAPVTLPRGSLVRLTDRTGRGFVVAECTPSEEGPQVPWLLKPLRAWSA